MNSANQVVSHYRTKKARRAWLQARGYGAVRLAEIPREVRVEFVRWMRGEAVRP